MMTNRYRGAVDFPLFRQSDLGESFEEGLCLRFTTDDLAQIEKGYAPDGRRIQVVITPTLDEASGRTNLRMDMSDYRTVVESGIRTALPSLVYDLIERGIKKPDGKTRQALGADIRADMPFSAAAAQGYVLDAWFLALTGKTATEMALEQAVAVEEAERQRRILEEQNAGDAGPFGDTSNGFSTPPQALDGTPIKYGR